MGDKEIEKSDFWSSIEYFDKTEFECKCGCGLNNISEDLVKKLDYSRKYSKVSFIVNSACRCKKHNQKIGGEIASSHLSGLACDIKVSSSRDRFLMLVALLQSGFNRIGVYKDFIHVDIDYLKSNNVIWHN